VQLFGWEPVIQRFPTTLIWGNESSRYRLSLACEDASAESKTAERNQAPTSSRHAVKQPTPYVPWSTRTRRLRNQSCAERTYTRRDRRPRVLGHEELAKCNDTGSSPWLIRHSLDLSSKALGSDIKTASSSTLIFDTDLVTPIDAPFRNPPGLRDCSLSSGSK